MFAKRRNSFKLNAFAQKCIFVQKSKPNVWSFMFILVYILYTVHIYMINGLWTFLILHICEEAQKSIHKLTSPSTCVSIFASDDLSIMLTHIKIVLAL